MKRILGLDLGTNSIGWALVNIPGDEDIDVMSRIEAAGSRVIPMTADVISNFENGAPMKTGAAKRTDLRRVRRMFERSHLRRERLHRVLDIMKFLPEHYAANLTRYGKFKDECECKLAWTKDASGKPKFLFGTPFQEMLADFREHQPELIADGRKVPYDWTIYYLRKKALTEEITKEELAWIILNFNQKRGYYQLRGDEESENSNKKEEYYALKVIRVEATDDKRGKDTWYNVHLENGMIYRRTSRVPLDWEGKTKEFIVTTTVDAEGNPVRDKEGNVKRSFRVPSGDDWTLLKKKTEKDIDDKNVTVGAYIYDELLAQPQQKIRGKFVHTIERKFYRDELEAILESQKRFHPELNDKELCAMCVEELYQSNEAHRGILKNCDFTRLLVDDIIFYQRPLKSKKTQIDDCRYESHTYVADKNTGETATASVKCIAKSHPLFQEFRLWQFLSNLRIYKKDYINASGRHIIDADVTGEFIPDDDALTALFDWLNSRKDIDQKTLLKYPPFKIKSKVDDYRWNYSDKVYPCNSTRAQMLTRLKKAGIAEELLTKNVELRLWHILYSIDGKDELCKALGKFAAKNGIDDADAFVEAFKRFPPFEKDYGAYSAKAIKKLLPLMRIGKYWQAEAIDPATMQRIRHIIDGEYDENIKERVRNKAINLTSVEHFSGLPLWLACYIVYDRHSEAKEIQRWKSPSDIDEYLRNFKQHSLRNPVVEQILTETLRVVRDIWQTYGNVDEIHVELGREMKNTAEKRKQISARIAANENTNQRIRNLLAEFMNPEYGIENVRPYSPYQQELLRIYEEDALDDVGALSDDILSAMTQISKKPTAAEVMKYKLWLDQKYRSPYTGRHIPLSRLFTTDYEIEHVIPRSRYFDDSLSNKVICESEVNKKKDNKLGHEFIKEHQGEIVPTSFGGKVKVLSLAEYEELVSHDYAHNRSKMKKLMMDDVPEEFIQRQLNDSRYIGCIVMSLLSCMVRDDDELESISRHVIPCNGSITDRLKKDWGINDVWNQIILPRFRRMNELTEHQEYTTMSRNGHELPTVPLLLQKGFSKKRIDHRHHAMDAIVIACASRNIVNYLNNESARSGAKVSRKDLQTLLCHKQTDGDGNRQWMMNKPWDSFTQDTNAALLGTVVSIKRNLRIMTKTVNHYQHYEDGEKKLAKQVKGESMAIRKSLHKATFNGMVNLRKITTMPLAKCLDNVAMIVDKELKMKIRELMGKGYDAKRITKYFDTEKDAWSDIDVKKIKVYYFTNDTKDRYYASRCSLASLFEKVTNADKAVEIITGKITDTGIQKILLNHLLACGNDPAEAFSADGIDRMNQNIVELNDGHKHQPIYSVRKYEKGEKYAVGERGNRGSKFVEAEKGTNLFYAIYENAVTDKKTGETSLKRSYQTIPLRTVIDRMKQNLPPVPTDENGAEPKYVLSPNDLVYVPTQEEIKQGKISEPIDLDRVYKFVSSSGIQSYFLPYCVASPIVNKFEFTSMNKAERAIDGTMIKEVCIPIKVDRLGRIIKIG